MNLICYFRVVSFYNSDFMKLLIIISFLSIFSLKSNAHDYYFAFAEMELNKESQKLEVTLILNSHDISHWLENKNFTLLDLEEPTLEKNLKEGLNNFLLSGFKISHKSDHYKLIFKGILLKDDGNIEFYFESQKKVEQDEVNITFDLLMNQYNQQQNKLIYLKELKKETYEFLSSKKSQIIKL